MPGEGEHPRRHARGQHGAGLVRFVDRQPRDERAADPRPHERLDGGVVVGPEDPARLGAVGAQVLFRGDRAAAVSEADELLLRDLVGGQRPTELRVGLILINFWMYSSGPSKIVISGQTFSAYDLVFCLVGATFVSLFALNTFKVAGHLRREDIVAAESKARYATSPDEAYNRSRKASILAK